jgi:6-phosphogluconolactonase (cycloisomerase 2 family)
MRSRRVRTVVLAGALAVLALASGCAPPISALTQIKTAAGCIAENEYGGQCRDGRFLSGASSASTPDGRFIYVVDGQALSIIARNPKTGDLSQKSSAAGCFSEDGSGGACKDGRALSSPQAVVATKSFVAAASFESDAVAVFTRNPDTGALKQPTGKAGCISETGESVQGDPSTTGQCADGRNLDGPSSLAVKGNTIVATTDAGIVLIKRNAENGNLSQPAGVKGCVTSDGSGGQCASGRGLVGTPQGVALDLPQIYVAVGNALLVFIRQADGTLTQDAGVNGCVSEDGTDGAAGPCTDGRALQGTAAVAVLSDGSIFVASTASRAVSQITRDDSGVLTQGAGAVGCISADGSGGQCENGRGITLPVGLATRGSTVFVASQGEFVDFSTWVPGAVAAVEVEPADGTMSQAAGTGACIHEDGADGCADGYAIDNPSAVTVAAKGPIFAASFGISAGPGFFEEGTLVALDRVPGTGVFTQGVEGKAGCVSETGQSDADDPGTAGKCINGVGIDGATAAAVSPDGKNVYVVSNISSAVAVFSRNASTGALTQLPEAKACISDTGAGQCANGRALSVPTDVTVSSDGKHVYVSSAVSDGVAIFRRNTSTGALTQPAGIAGCITEAGLEGCLDGRSLDTAKALAIAPDGNHVYVASDDSDGVSILSRNAASGALTQSGEAEGCVSQTINAGSCTNAKALERPFDVAVSQDGNSVYVAAVESQAITVFSRDDATGALSQLADPNGCVSDTGRSDPDNAGSAGECTDGDRLGAPTSVIVTQDATVYARGAFDSLVILARDGSTGALTPSGCHSEDSSGGACADASAVTGFGQVATTATTENSVYLASPQQDGIAAFDRDDSTGNLTQVAAPYGCVTDATFESCTIGKALDLATGIGISPDNRHVYVAAVDDDAVAVFARSTTN